MKEIKHKWILLLVLALTGFAFDWYTKFFAVTHFTYGVPVPVIGDYFQFLLVYNKGALFGIDPHKLIAGFPTNQFFYIFNTLAILILLLYYKKISKKDRLMHWAIAFIFPGALGNLWDRVLHAQKGVVDFIKVGISQDVYWPIFNMADVYVTIGVGVLVCCFIMDEKKRKNLSCENKINACKESIGSDFETKKNQIAK